MKNIPDIRFEEFSDEWHNISLGDIAERLTRKNTNLESSLPLTISAQYGLIDQNEFFDKRIASKDVSNYYLLYKGDFAYNKSTSSEAPWGAVKRLDRYDKGVLSSLYIVFKLKDESKTDSDFVVAYYCTDKWHKEVQAISAEGARNHGLLNISPNDYFQTALTIPQNVNEQKEIGYFFSVIDSMISDLSKKYETLKSLKDTMLSKMFPKEGESVPEIRFEGFTDDWEQHKLGEILEITTRTNSDGEYNRENVLSVSDEYGVINQIKFQGRSFAAEDVTGYKKVIKDDIIYTRSPLAAKPFGIIKKVNNEEGIVSPLYIVNVATEGNDSSFIYYNFDMPEKTNNYLRPLVRMGAKHTMNISNDEWLSGEIYAPTLAEQKKIGEYFEALDNLIIVHQRKLQDLQGIKKALLQKMFI